MIDLKLLIDRRHALSIRKQCEILEINRSGLYYEPKGEPQENLEIMEIMDKFYATAEQKEEVLELYKCIENKSSLLNRSRPQSVASGIVRYYILQKGKDVPIAVFKAKVNLSELTINRIVKEIERILEPSS